MHSVRLALVLVILLMAAGGAAAARSTAPAKHPDKAHGHLPVPGPAPPPAPAPTPAPTTAPASAPVAHLRVVPTPVAASSGPAASPSGDAPTPAVESTPGGATSGSWRLHDPTLEPGLQEASSPVAMGLVVAPTPSGGFPWGAALVGLLALGAVVAVGARPHKAALLPPRAIGTVKLNLVPIDVPSLLRAAQEAIKAGRLQEGVAWLDQALALDATLAVAHFCRGVCLVGLARPVEAREALRRAYALDPNEGAYILELSRACARTGEANEALARLAPLLSAAPEMAQDIAEDEAFAALRDHPHFLALVGLL